MAFVLLEASPLLHELHQVTTVYLDHLVDVGSGHPERHHDLDDQFVAGWRTEVGRRSEPLGQLIPTQYVPTTERSTRRFPLLLTTGRILSQYNVGAQTRRTENSRWHEEDRIELHPVDAEDRGIKSDDWVGIESRSGQTVLRALVTERMQPGVVYTTFHFPESGANVITTNSSDWATNCPEYKVTAVQATRVALLSDWQQRYARFNDTQTELLQQRIVVDTVK